MKKIGLILVMLCFIAIAPAYNVYNTQTRERECVFCGLKRDFEVENNNTFYVSGGPFIFNSGRPLYYSVKIYACYHCSNEHYDKFNSTMDKAKEDFVISNRNDELIRKNRNDPNRLRAEEIDRQIQKLNDEKFRLEYAVVTLDSNDVVIFSDANMIINYK